MSEFKFTTIRGEGAQDQTVHPGIRGVREGVMEDNWTEQTLLQREQHII